MKIMRSLLALSIFFTQLYGTAPTVARHRAAHLTNKIFGKHGTRSKNSHRQEIESLLHDILQATEQQKICIAKRVIHFLERDIKKTMKALEKDPSNKIAYDHSLFILQTQKKHLVDYISENSSKTPWYKHLWKRLETCTYYVCETITDKKCQAFEEKVALAFDFYLNFEREHIFTDYTKTVYLFAGHRNHSLPSLLTVWQDPRARSHLLHSIKKIYPPLRPQLEELAPVVEDVFVGLADEMTEEAVTELATQTAKEIVEEEIATSAEGIATTAQEELEEIAGSTEKEVTENFNLEEFEGTADSFADDAASTTEEAGQAGEDKITEKEPSKREKRRADRKAKREAVETKENELLENPKTSKVKKAAIKTKQFKRFISQKIGLRTALDFTQDYITGPINDLYKNYIFDTFISGIEDNALKKSMDSLPHWMRGVVDISIQMNIMLGGGLVIFWTNKDDAKIQEKYTKANTAIATLNTRLSTEIMSNMAEKRKVDLDEFHKKVFAGGTIDTERGKLSENFLAEKIYMNKASIDQAPLNSYTTTLLNAEHNNSTESPFVTDQRFSLSKMLTPEGGSVWHNVFRSGKWVFSQDLNGFHQTQLVKIAGKDSKTQAAQALYNSIFTEYIPEKTSTYTITAECTLISYTEPFFFGLLFNNARWISGVPDRYQQQRFAGLYGNNGKIYAVLDESKNSTKKERDGSMPGTQWPAYKVLQHPEKYMLESQLIEISKKPATFIFSITTKPTEASATITPSLQPSAGKTLNQSGLNLSVYSFHGIGFMSAGCVAQFKLTTPKTLTYSSAQIEEFKRLVSSQ